MASLLHSLLLYGEYFIAPALVVVLLLLYFALCLDHPTVRSRVIVAGALAVFLVVVALAEALFMAPDWVLAQRAADPVDPTLLTYCRSAELDPPVLGFVDCVFVQLDAYQRLRADLALIPSGDDPVSRLDRVAGVRARLRASACFAWLHPSDYVGQAGCVAALVRPVAVIPRAIRPRP